MTTLTATRRLVNDVLDTLDLAVVLSRSAAKSKEPARAAVLLTGAIDDLRPEMRELRAIARHHLGVDQET